MNSKEDTFDSIYELMRDRLKHVGLIRPDDAWHICRGKTSRGYATIVQNFTKIMATMIEQGKAVKERRGLYRIIKPDTKAN